MSCPLVSVCVPTRNQAAYLGGALVSALAQEIELEVLVHDDASSDGTETVVRQIADPRVRYLRNHRALGIARNRNGCLAHARGLYVAWLDSDDEYLPGMLAQQVAALEENPGSSLAHGGFHVIGAGGDRLPDWPAPFDRDTVEPAHDAFPNLIASNEITTSTVVVRRACHQAQGGFRPGVGASSSDWDAWLRIARQDGVVYTADPVARYRQHPESISAATSASGERLRCDVAVVRRILGRHAHRLPLTRVAHAALAAKALAHAGDLFTRGHRCGSARAVVLAVRLAPAVLGQLAPRLLLATQRGDGYACYRTTKAMLGLLADRLEGTRFGIKVRASAASDPEWESALERIAQVARQVLPPEASVAAIAKWDPTLLRLIGREGRNFPDRRLMPGGYPRDGAAAVEHLEQLRREGVSHLVVPGAYSWWLDHYSQLAEHLDDRYHLEADSADCVVFDLRRPDGQAPQIAAR